MIIDTVDCKFKDVKLTCTHCLQTEITTISFIRAEEMLLNTRLGSMFCLYCGMKTLKSKELSDHYNLYVWKEKLIKSIELSFNII